MKFLSILLLLVLPLVALAERLESTESGCQNADGSIQFHHGLLSVSGREFRWFEGGLEVEDCQADECAGQAFEMRVIPTFVNLDKAGPARAELIQRYGATLTLSRLQRTGSRIEQSLGRDDQGNGCDVTREITDYSALLEGKRGLSSDFEDFSQQVQCRRVHSLYVGQCM